MPELPTLPAPAILLIGTVLAKDTSRASPIKMLAKRAIIIKKCNESVNENSFDIMTSGHRIPLEHDASALRSSFVTVVVTVTGITTMPVEQLRMS